MNVTITTLNITKEFLKLIDEEFKAPLHAITVFRSNILKEIEDTNVLMPERTPVDVSILDKAPILKLVQSGAGYDYVDLEAGKRKVFLSQMRQVLTSLLL